MSGAWGAAASFGVFAALVFVVNVAAAALVRVPRARPGEEMRLLDHLRELQLRLTAVVAAGVALVALFFGFGLRRVGAVAVPWPSVEESVAALAFRALAERFTPAGVELVVTSPLDGVLALVVVALALAAVGLVPVVAWHAGMFLGPALVERERRLAVLALPAGGGLFLLGAFFAWHVVVPTIFRALYGYAAALDARLLLSVHSLVTFAAVLLVVFGIAFELPLFMAALTRAGFVQARTWLRGWRHAVVAIVIVAAVVTPDPTVVSQVFVAVPLLGLYALGATAAWAARPPAAA